MTILLVLLAAACAASVVCRRRGMELAGWPILVSLLGMIAALFFAKNHGVTESTFYVGMLSATWFHAELMACFRNDWIPPKADIQDIWAPQPITQR